MRNLILRSLAGAMAITAMGCVDLDEKLVTGVSGAYLSTPAGIEAAVVASYAQLRNYYGREQMLSLLQVGTDTWSDADQPASNNREFGSATVNSSMGPLANIWTPSYLMINNLNAVIERAPSVSGIPVARLRSRIGEARFLRALEYFNLVRTFGDVTLSLSEIKAVQGTAVRDPAATIYAAILADLDAAVDSLPIAPDGGQQGRATRGAAMALRAKVFLEAGHKPYVGNINYRGSALSATSAFTNAKADADSVIGSGTYSLEPVYANLWCVARAADPGRSGYCENNGYNNVHNEFIFTVQFSDASADYDADNQYNYLHLVYLSNYDNVSFGVGIARDLNNGRPFRRLMPTPFAIWLYEQTRWTDTASARQQIVDSIMDTRFDGSYQSTWIATAGGSANPTTCPPTGGFCTSGTIVNIGDTTGRFIPFPVDTTYRRARKYTIRTMSPTAYRIPRVDSAGLQRVNQATPAGGWALMTSGLSNGWWSWDRYPTMKKFQDNTRTDLTSQIGGKVQVLMRLGEVYLDAAEASVMLGQTAAAAGYINTLRLRAANPTFKPGNVLDTRLAVTAGQMNIDYILDEREREMGGEFTRWYDLVRVSSGATNYYVNRVRAYNPNAAPNIQAYHMLRPIPQLQIDALTDKTGYPQNPGY